MRISEGRGAPPDRDDRVPESAKGKPQRGIAALEVAGRILSAIEHAPGPLTLREISQYAATSASRAHHYLVSLTRLGFVRQDQRTGRYGLGHYALQLGLAALERVDAGRESDEVLHRFRDETGETAFFALWGSHGPTIVTWCEGRRPVTVQVRAGLVMSLLLSATGHIFLTWMSEDQLKPVLDREIAAERPASRRALTRRINELRAATREHGLSSIRGSLLPHIAALSAPVFAHDGRLVGALSTLGWIDAFNASPGGPTARALLRQARYFSSTLGFRPKRLSRQE
ncbi:MAG: IclR family transcriptional regulator [Burkholderiaceae bacterium]